MYCYDCDFKKNIALKQLYILQSRIEMLKLWTKKTLTFYNMLLTNRQKFSPIKSYKHALLRYAEHLYIEFDGTIMVRYIDERSISSYNVAE